MSSSEARREQRIQARKLQIMYATAELITRKGFSKTTTKDIAEAAEIAEGTIYNYFASKEDILIELVNHTAQLEDRAAQLDVLLQEPQLYSALVKNMRERMDLIQDVLPFYLAILPEILSTPPLRERYYKQIIQPLSFMLEKFLEKSVEREQMSALDVPLTARMINATILGFQVMHILGDETFVKSWEDSQHFSETYITLLLKGLEADKTDS